jgi:hypothetical protein
VFLHPIGSTGHVVHFGASGPQNITTIFFILEWAQCSFHEKRTGTRYSELEFLHPVGSAGHVVHSIASGTQNVDGLFFMLRWAWCGFPVQNFYFWIRWDLRVTYCILVRPRHETSTHHFSCSIGPSVVSIKSAQGHVMPSLCFCIR